MTKLANIRWVPVVGWVFTVAGFILSLATLLAGSAGENPRAAAIATFNVSYLGLSEFHNPNSNFGQNVINLVPSNLTNPPSITAYLGIKDWYAMHYLSICSGFYELSSTNPQQLSSTKVNVTCSRQQSGYTFSLYDTLQEGLAPSVEPLVYQIPNKEYNTKPWIALWYVGIVFAFLEAIAIPFTLTGVRRNNLHCLIGVGISFIALDISAGIATGHVLNVHRSGQGPYPEGFLGLVWSSCVCLGLAWIAEQLEWKYQIWTPVGQQITIYRKPKNASWWAMRPPGSHKFKSYWDARHGI